MAQRVDVQYIRFYTEGSAARQVTPVSDNKTATRLPRRKKRSKTVIYVDPLAVLGLAAAVCMLIVMAVGLVKFYGAQAQMQQMQSYAAQLSRQNEALEAQYREGYDLAEVEKQAAAMGMIPKAQAPTVTVVLPQPAQEPQPGFWQRVGTFLTGLFA